MMKKSRIFLSIFATAALALTACAKSSDSAAVAATDASHDGAQWTSDYEAALSKAKAEHKQVLLDFTGSDWCPWCIKMDEDVLSKPEFTSYASDNLVLVTVDFPRKKELAEDVKAQNQKLQDRFQVQGLPTYVLLDAEGNEIKRWEGYVSGGPKVFVNELSEQKKG